MKFLQILREICLGFRVNAPFTISREINGIIRRLDSLLGLGNLSRHTTYCTANISSTCTNAVIDTRPSSIKRKTHTPVLRAHYY